MEKIGAESFGNQNAFVGGSRAAVRSPSPQKSVAPRGASPQRELGNVTDRSRSLKTSGKSQPNSGLRSSPVPKQQGGATTPATPSAEASDLGAEQLRLEPEFVVFQSVRSHVRERQLVKVSNYGSKSQTFSLTNPKSAIFKVYHANPGGEAVDKVPATVRIIPGFSYSFWVELNPANFLSRVDDEIALVTKENESSRLVLSLAAVPSQPCVLVDERPDLGVMVLQKTVTHSCHFTAPLHHVNEDKVEQRGSFVIKNKDANSVIVKCKSQSSNLVLASSLFNIAPAGSATVNFLFISTEYGDYEYMIELECFRVTDANESGTDFCEASKECVMRKVVTVVAKVVESKVRLLDLRTGVPLKNAGVVQFGKLHYGQTAAIDLILENVTDELLLAVFKYSGIQEPSTLKVLDGGATSVSLCSLLLAEKMNIMLSCLSVNPISATVLPREKIPLRLTFTPQPFDVTSLAVPLSSSGTLLNTTRFPAYYNSALNLRTWAQQGEQKTFILPLRLHVTSEPNNVPNLTDFFVRSNHFDLLCEGSVFPLQVRCKQSEIIFTPLAKGDSETRSLSLVNLSTELPVVVHLEKLPHFRCEEYAYHLEPSSSIEVPITFLPNQLGQLDRKMVILVTSSISSKLLDARAAIEGTSFKGHQRLGIIEVILTASCLTTYPCKIVLADEQASEKSRGRTPSHLISHMRAKALCAAQKAGNNMAHSESPVEGSGKLSLSNGLVFQQSDIEQVCPQTNREREQYYARRRAYDDYIREQRLIREGNLLRRMSPESVDEEDSKELVEFFKGISDKAPSPEKSPVTSAKKKSKTYDGYYFVDLLKGLSPNRLLELQNELNEPRVDRQETLETNGKNIYRLEAESLLTQRLSLVNLAELIVPTKLIDIGSVTMRSAIAFPINFYNGNLDGPSMSISLALVDDTKPGVRIWPPTIQILPGEVNGFGAYFLSDVVGPVQQTINYVVNGLHRFNLKVQAEVVPLALVVEPSIMAMDFSEVSIDSDAYLDTQSGGYVTKLTSDKSRKLTVMFPGAAIRHSANFESDNLSQFNLQFMFTESHITIKNPGTSDIGFYWSVASKSSRVKTGAPSLANITKRQAIIRTINFKDEDSCASSSTGTFPNPKSINKLQAPDHPWFLVSPAYGKIKAKSEVSVTVRCIFGLHSAGEETFQVDAVDFSLSTNAITQTITVPFSQKMETVDPIITHSGKHAHLDFGILPVSSEDGIKVFSAAESTTIVKSLPPAASANASNPENAPNLSAFAKTLSATKSSKLASSRVLQTSSEGKAPKAKLLSSLSRPDSESLIVAAGPLLSTKTVRLKNLAKGRTMFVVSLDSDVDVHVEPKFGYLSQLSSGIDISITPSPSKEGFFENAINIQVYGHPTPLRLPFRYQARYPEVEVVQQTSRRRLETPVTEGGIPIKISEVDELRVEEDLEMCMIGTELHTCFKVRNSSQYSCRCFVNLFDYDELGFWVKEVEALESSGINSFGGPNRVLAQPVLKKQTHDAAEGSNLAEKSSLKISADEIAACNDLSTFTKPKTLSISLGKDNADVWKRLINKLDQQNLKLHVFDIQPFSTLLGQLRITPKLPKIYAQDIPLYFYGLSTPKMLSLKMRAVLSPLELSKKDIRFKNRVVSNGRDTMDNSMMGSHIGSSSNGSAMFFEGSSMSFSNGHTRSVSGSNSFVGENGTEGGNRPSPSYNPCNEHSNVQTVTVTNTSNRSVTFFIGKPIDSNKVLKRSPFQVHPAKDTLEPGAQVSLSVYFRPTKRGKFSCKIPIYIDRVTETFPLSLNVIGNGVSQAINFDPPEITFPVGPPEVQTVMPLYLFNFGCERTDVRVSVPPEISQTMGELSVLFPEGKYLKYSGDKILVLIKFQSKSLAELRGRPVGFSTKIEFRDNKNNYFYLPVHYVGESSAICLTGAQFLLSHASVQANMREVNPGVLFYDAHKLNDVDLKKAYLQDKSNAVKRLTIFGCDLNSSVLPQWEDCLMESLRCMHNRIVAPVQGKSFEEISAPYYYAQSYGLVILQSMSNMCDFNLSGTKYSDVFFRKAQHTSTSFADNAGASSFIDSVVTESYEAVVNFLNQLKSSGLNLSVVKPEYLLTPEAYQEYVDMLKQELPLSDEEMAHYEHVGQHHVILAKESWFLILCQCMNVAVTSQFPTLKFIQYHANNHSFLEEAAKINVEDSYGSNICNTGDYCLRQFYTLIYRLETGRTWSIPFFGRSFGDCYIWSVAIKHYIPELHRQFLRGMHSSDEGRIILSTEQMEFNVRAMQRALSSLFLNDDLNAFITMKSCKSYSTVVAYMVSALLYSVLPQFNQLTNVHVTCKMYSTVAKLVEMTNQLSQDVEFRAAIEPNIAISLPRNSFLVPAKGCVAVRVEVTAKTTYPVSAIVYMIPKRLVFNAISLFTYRFTVSMTQLLPLNTLNMQAPVFSTSPTSLELKLHNPLAQSGIFEISVLQQKDAGGELHAVESDGERLPSIRLRKRKIEIAGHGKASINLDLLPLRIGAELYYIRFSNPKVGDFVYAVKCFGTLPAVEQVYHYECPTLITFHQSFGISNKNSQREKAAEAYLKFLEDEELPEWLPDEKGQLHYVPAMSDAILSPEKKETSGTVRRNINVDQKLTEQQLKLRAIQREANKNISVISTSLQHLLRWPKGQFLHYKVYVLPIDEALISQQATLTFQKRLFEKFLKDASHCGQLGTSSSIFKAFPEILVSNDPNMSDAERAGHDKVTFDFYAMKPGRSACYILLKGENLHDYRLFLVTIGAKLESINS